jgi:hypothetical protein
MCVKSVRSQTNMQQLPCVERSFFLEYFVLKPKGRRNCRQSHMCVQFVRSQANMQQLPHVECSFFLKCFMLEPDGQRSFDSSVHQRESDRLNYSGVELFEMDRRWGHII